MCEKRAGFLSTAGIPEADNAAFEKLFLFRPSRRQRLAVRGKSEGRTGRRRLYCLKRLFARMHKNYRVASRRRNTFTIWSQCQGLHRGSVTREDLSRFAVLQVPGNDLLVGARGDEPLRPKGQD